MAAGSITVYPDSPESYKIDLEEGKTLLIGRKQAAGGQRKLVIAVPEVSGQHAEISPSPDGWTIRDSGSTNGTRLNGDRLTPGREYLLRNGDRVKIAHVDLAIMLPEEAFSRGEEVEPESHEKTHLQIKLINATILVGDIRGFTTLMEDYASQPEVVMQSAQLVFQCLNEEINGNQGQLEKIAGDAIMAYWQDEDGKSAPLSYAYRACYTALRLRSLVTALAQNKDFWPFASHPLQLDLALATGPVAAGALGNRGEASPALLGDTANLAFRLEKLIGADTPGDIVVDGPTYEQVKDQFSFVRLGEFNVKGRQRSVDVHRLVSIQRFAS